MREAARLQTFPDSYVFLGNRTPNTRKWAMPCPRIWLARSLTAIVGIVLHRAGMADASKFSSCWSTENLSPGRRVEAMDQLRSVSA